MVCDRTESENNGSPRIFHDLWWNCKLLEFVLKRLYWVVVQFGNPLRHLKVERC